MLRHKIGKRTERNSFSCGEPKRRKVENTKTVQNQSCFCVFDFSPRQAKPRIKGTNRRQKKRKMSFLFFLLYICRAAPWCFMFTPFLPIRHRDEDTTNCHFVVPYASSGAPLGKIRRGINQPPQTYKVSGEPKKASLLKEYVALDIYLTVV